ncbi:MAG: protein phosphatase CheZ [Alphaproteobacteria bacterium]|nr:protein phosphatase CheZ [Alphaproteobacteria bacterium]
MSAGKIDKDLALRLDELRREHGDTVRLDRVAEVVRSLLSTMSGDLDAKDIRLYQELEALANYIHAARAEIAALRPDEIQNHYIASATDELDAIVGATESATNEILDACEQLETMLTDLPPEMGQRLTDATTRIYEACNFQDITGQRITKVVRALKHIEQKIEALVAAFGPAEPKAEAKPPPPEAAADEVKQVTDEDLLNGPQLPERASRQADIDALFASFD